MSFLLQPLHLVLTVLSEIVHTEQQEVIEYLQLVNQILREKLGGKRVLLNDEQRRVSAVKGKALGRQQLGKMATIVQADTILRWHRELIDPQGDSKVGHKMGWPPIDQEVVDLVPRMARENASWGYKRIEGALHNLGYAICSSTVANILTRHASNPADSPANNQLVIIPPSTLGCRRWTRPGCNRSLAQQNEHAVHLWLGLG